MTDKIAELEAKVTQVLEKFERLRRDDAVLVEQNAELRAQLSRLTQEFEAFQVSQNDQTELIRSKLNSVLGRIADLEKIGL